jgi:ABC-type Fe3+/spermidine/putrescine transport system ATPase subunit
MNEGRIEQAGTQLDIYLRPRTEFVAGIVGDNNAIPGEVVGLIEGASSEPGLVDVRGEACGYGDRIPETCASATTCWRL